MRRRANSDCRPAVISSRDQRLDQEVEWVGQPAQIKGCYQRQTNHQLNIPADAEKSQAAPAVFGQSAGHDFGLGFRGIKRRQLQFAHQPDHGNDEPDRLDNDHPQMRLGVSVNLADLPAASQ